jgi:two-component system, OmpR family, sensor kinase
MIFNSIRWRLQAWHGLILLSVLVGFGFTAYQVARDNQRRRIDQELEQRFWMTLRMPPPEPPPMEGQRHSGPPPEGGRREHEHPGGRFEPEKFRERLIESMQRAASSEAGQTNSYYFVMWDCEGGVLATSSNAPPGVASPRREEPAPSPAEADASKTSFVSGKGPGKPANFSTLRTRGELREIYGFSPSRDCLLVGRSMAPDMAAMRRLALWLVAAGTGILAFGLAGGWWLASRAIRPVEDISATALKIAGGDLSQRINAADTESELGRLAAVLNSTFARLEASFAHQSRFTSDASHELRTPVSVILAQVQSVLSKERGGAEYREALEACQRAALRMRRLTESLLELARLDAGQQPMKRERFDLARVARDSLELIRPLAAERGLEIKCDLNSAECLGDAERIGQVATNLLSNAIHFNRERGQVRISTRSENGSAVLQVEDTGTGIPPEDLPHIFERFYRVDKSRSRVQGRTGLGLAISKAIVDAHTGVIEVTSEPERGSTFQVKLPAK